MVDWNIICGQDSPLSQDSFTLTTAIATQLVGVVHWDVYDSVGISDLKDSSLRIGDSICVLFRTEFRYLVWCGSASGVLLNLFLCPKFPQLPS
jgi:hypothetical protein